MNPTTHGMTPTGAVKILEAALRDALAFVSTALVNDINPTMSKRALIQLIEEALSSAAPAVGGEEAKEMLAWAARFEPGAERPVAADLHTWQRALVAKALRIAAAQVSCAKCGCDTRGEAALVGDQTWCHPCADAAPAVGGEADDPFNRRQVEAVCRAVCGVEGVDPDSDVYGDGCDPQWSRYADAVAAALYTAQPAPPLRGREVELREALEFGVWSLSGPTNAMEEKMLNEQVEEAWQDFKRQKAASAPPEQPPSFAERNLIDRFDGDVSTSLSPSHQVPVEKTSEGQS